MTRAMKTLLLLLLMCAVALSGPLPSGVSGEVTQGSSLVVTGADFGTKASAAPYAYDDFEDGVDSDCSVVTEPCDPGWTGNGADPTDWDMLNFYDYDPFMAGGVDGVAENHYGFTPFYSDHQQRFAGDMSVCMDFYDGSGGNGTQRSIGLWSPAGTDHRSSTWYISYWIYSDDYYGDAGDITNAKIWGNFFEATPGTPDGYYPTAIWQDQWTAGAGSYIAFTDCGHDIVFQNNGLHVDAFDQWIRIEMYIDFGTAGVADGAFRADVNLSTVMDRTEELAPSGCTGEEATFGCFYLGNNVFGTGGAGPRLACYVSELYTDHTQARVEIGNASTFAACTHREIQIPTAWATDEITVSCNVGSFTSGASAWVYVFDSNGDVNSTGYQIEIGATESSSGVGDPLLSRGGDNNNTLAASWDAPSGGADFYHVYVNRTDTPQGGGAIVPGSDYAVSSSDVDDTYDALLSVPRHKMHMSPTQPDSLWLIYSTGGSYISANGGETWGAGPDFGTYDMHAGIWGVGQDIYFTAISAGGPRFAKATAATVAVDDSLAWGDVGSHSVTTVDEDGRWWIFTRDSDDDWECLEYNYSDNDGTSWTHAALLPRGSCALRLGAFLIDGAAAVMVKDERSPYDYWLYRWNGSSFSDLGQVAIGTQRRFSMAYTDDGTVHLIYAKADDLIHATASWSGASLGAWSEEYVVNDDPDAPVSLPEFMWCPIVTQWGENLLIAAINNEAGWAHAWLWNPTTGLGTETDLGIPTGEIQMDGTQFPGIQAPARMPSSATYWPVAWFDNVGDDINVIQVALPDGDSAAAQRTGVTAETSMDITVPATYDISVFVRAYDSEGNALSTSDTTNVDGS